MAAGEPAAHEQIAQGLSDHPAKTGCASTSLSQRSRSVAASGCFTSPSGGADDVVSYLNGCIAPVVGGLMVWAAARRFSGAAVAIFTFTALSAVVALVGSTVPKVLLYKDCAATVLIGVIFPGSSVLVP